MPVFGICPRCQRPAIEHLRTHSYCWECGCSPTTDPELAEWQRIEFRPLRFRSHTSKDPSTRWFAGRPLQNIGLGGVI